MDLLHHLLALARQLGDTGSTLRAGAGDGPAARRAGCGYRVIPTLSDQGPVAPAMIETEQRAFCLHVPAGTSSRSLLGFGA